MGWNETGYGDEPILPDKAKLVPEIALEYLTYHPKSRLKEWDEIPEPVKQNVPVAWMASALGFVEVANVPCLQTQEA